MNKIMNRILLTNREAAVACGVNPKTWRTWSLLGFTPKPVAIGKRQFWRHDELIQWANADCPRRDDWAYRPEIKNFQKLCPFAGRPA